MAMKSVSLVDSNAVRNHPSNNSPSKNAYQFSKTRRFADYNPECKIAFYGNDSMLSHRSTSFGYGTKVDFTKPTTCSPPPTKYHARSSIEEGKNKGKSFGLPRDSSPDRSYIIPQLQKVPGPGQYENEKQLKNISYSMRARTIDILEKQKSNKDTPGPGSYKELDLDPKTGRFNLSKFSDVKLAKINPRSERFDKIRETPGPCLYKQGDGLSNRGKYVLSNHRGTGTVPFNQTARSTFTDEFRKTFSKMPGPGDYEKPSEFGVYGDSKYYKTMSGFKTIQ